MRPGIASRQATLRQRGVAFVVVLWLMALLTILLGALAIGALAFFIRRGIVSGLTGVQTMVTRIEGEFEKGDVVRILGSDGAEFARGQVNYGRADAAKLVGRRSDEARGGVPRGYDALVTRNNVVVREAAGEGEAQ